MLKLCGCPMLLQVITLPTLDPAKKICLSVVQNAHT